MAALEAALAMTAFPSAAAIACESAPATAPPASSAAPIPQSRGP